MLPKTYGVPIYLPFIELIVCTNSANSIVIPSLLSGYKGRGPHSILYTYEYTEHANYYFKLLQGLLKSLVVEEESICCCSQNLKCWRHSLKSIKLINVKGFESNTVLNAMTLSKLTTYLDNWATEARRTVMFYGEFKVETLSFHLSW